MRRTLYWVLLQAKRLYKKATFLILLALVPISILALGVAADQGGGVVRVALAASTEDDPVSIAVIDELTHDPTIIGFYRYPTPSEAIEAVSVGEVDEAWIFVADATLRMQEFASTASSGEPFVTMVGREDSFFLSLMREKLSATLYKHCAKALYIDFAREYSPELDSLTDEELIAYFDAISIGEDLFELSTLSDEDGGQSDSGSYLTAPVRGLLGILCVVCGLAASMYYLDDDRRGAYAKIPESRRLWVAFVTIAVAVVNVTAISLVSMQLAGVGVSILRELAAALVCTLAVSSFCLLIMTLFRDNRMIGALVLPISVVMIGVCPVFFDLKALAFLQLMFPPTYYVHSAHSAQYLLYGVAYCAACLGASVIADRLRGALRLPTR